MKTARSSSDRQGASGVAGRAFEALTRTARREVVLAGLLAVALGAVGTGATPIFGRDEARFSQAAREMLARGDMVVPTFAGEGRYHKPILIYWCTMASYRALGVTERAARIPSNVAAAVVVALLAGTARRRWGPGSGLLAGMLLLVAPVVWLEARACTADMVLLLPTLVVMLAFERLLTGEGSRPAAIAFWVGMGVAILAKGPIAPLWVACTALVLWVMGRRWRRWELAAAAALLVVGAWWLGPTVLVVPTAIACWHAIRSPQARRVMARLQPAWGVPLLLAMTLPWAIAATVATEGAFLRTAVGEHVIDRSLTAFESHGFFVGFYVVTAVVVAFPWTGLLLASLPSQRQHSALDVRWRFLVAWLVGPLVMLELVQTKLVHYWIPSYPAGVLLAVGGLWALASSSPAVGVGRAVLAIGGAAIAALLVAAPLLVSLPKLVVPAVVAAVPLLVATATSAVLLGRRPRVAAAVVTGGGLLALVAVSGLCLPLLGRHSLGPLTAQRAVEVRQPGEEIVIFKPRDEEIYFYLPLTARTCPDAACMVERFGDGSKALGVARREDLEVLRHEWRAARIVEVDRVEGVDVGTARWRQQVLFRIPDLDRRVRRDRGVDRRGRDS